MNCLCLRCLILQDECYDKMWDSVLDEFNAQCMGAMYTGNNATLGPERWCFFCCLFASEMDGCNKDGHMHRVPLPEENNWDPNMNWDYSMKSIEEENAAHTLTRSIVSVVFSSALYLALTSLLWVIIWMFMMKLYYMYHGNNLIEYFIEQFTAIPMRK